MRHTYFKIRFELDREEIHRTIDRQIASRIPGYICVVDGVIVNMVQRVPDYLDVVNGSLFSICDSGYVPIYIKWIYGLQYKQYAGAEIFRNIVTEGKHRMIFLGAQQHVLDGLRENLTGWNPEVADMKFVELPFADVDGFDYPAIARMIEEDGADIIWVALGAPKQERFMARLRPHLKHGVMLAVGAAFKYYSGIPECRRAPQWMVSAHIEFLYRIFREPKKQIARCFHIVRTLPGILAGEWREKRRREKAARRIAEVSPASSQPASVAHNAPKSIAASVNHLINPNVNAANVSPTMVTHTVSRAETPVEL
ncbi:MAG: WecB/TagA/CpsF family glycosyltransferase [Muribaculaceae bacterium]|nr:WecB/TagA/CpsF family glycosyltransferase [Muribaculaceae bacterium]